MRNPILALLLIAILTVPIGAAPRNGASSGNANPASATSGEDNSNSDKKLTKVPNDNTVARDAVKQHQYLSLESVMALVAKSSTGRVLDLELVLIGGVLAYRVTVFEADGRLHKLYYNARTGVRVDSH